MSKIKCKKTNLSNFDKLVFYFLKIKHRDKTLDPQFNFREIYAFSLIDAIVVASNCGNNFKSISLAAA